MNRKNFVLIALVLLTGFATAQTSVNLDVDKVNMEPVPLQTSEYADIWLEVTNDGDTEAEDVELEFTENYPFSVDRGDRKSWDVGTLVPGEEYLVHLQTRVDENAVQGVNEIEFRTTSSSGISVTHSVPVEVRSDNDLLTISDVEFPATVAPGSDEEMTFSINNLADGQIKNIEVKLDLSNVPIATSGTTSQAVTKLESDSSTEASFELNIDESAENSVHKIPVSMTYENEAGTEFTRETTVGAVIGGQPDLKAGLNGVESELTPGSTGTVTIRLVNQGRGSADFVELNIEDSEEFEVLSPNSVYLGSMDADDYQTADFQIHVSSEAENISAPVQISYSDAAGEESLTQSVEIPVYTQSQLQSYGLASSGSPLPLIIVIVLIGGGVYYWRKKRS
ncbi:COG1361 S-layer family protein [Candidatus Nanosalina sp. VS9-1]|uniref:COG1361 S-layer family protein n=1 Tax=Candidatus Nanosalina sp. VS9-1 TaxID=3388566 RepID=UPI0039E0FC26